MSCTPEAREELLAIVSRAFGIKDGYLELNNAIRLAAGFDMQVRIGMDGSPMQLVVAKLASEVESVGAGAACLDALFVKYPGSSELRGWVGTHQPGLLAKIDDATFDAARAGYEKDRQERRVGIIAANLTAISQKITLDEQQKEVSRRMIARLDDLEAFKAVHDLLHTLQGTLLVELDRNAGPAIPAEGRRYAVSDLIDRLAQAILDTYDLRDEFAALTAEPEGCEAIVTGLRVTLDTLSAGEWTDPLTPRKGFMKLRTMLRAQMTVFDGRLVGSSKEIPFAELSAIFRNLANPAQSPALPEARRDMLLSTAEALDATARRLDARREIHQLWQRMDGILHNVEQVLWGTAPNDILTSYWEDIGDTIRGLSEIDPQQCAGLIAEAQTIELIAATRFTPMPETINRDFNRFIAKARFLFLAADKALKRDCMELRRLHKPLETLLENQE